MEKLSTLGRRSQIKLRSVKSNQIAPEARARAASSGVRGDRAHVDRAARSRSWAFSDALEGRGATRSGHGAACWLARSLGVHVWCPRAAQSLV